MKLTRLAIIILTTIICGAGLVWWHSQPNSTTTPRPLYGIASLSKEEKQMLYQPFVNCRIFGCGYTNIYRVGMICFKHRLTRFEVMEAVSESPVKPINNGYLDYQTSIGHLLTFKFDASGNLLWVRTEDRIELPPLESVSPNTPIEPPR